MKFLIFVGLLFLPCLVSAAPPVAEAQIVYVGAGTTVSISTDTGAVAAWTVVPTTVGLNRRSGLKVSNPSSNTSNVVCILDTAAPTEATTVRPIEIQPWENPFIPARFDIFLYCISLASSAESVHVQEAGQ